MKEIVRSHYESYPYPLRKMKTKKELIKYVKWLLPVIGTENKEDFFANKKVLEAGCGTGELSAGIALQKAKEIISIDLSFNSLKQALRYKKKFNLSNMFLVQADIESMPLNKKFDVIISLGALHHNENPKKLFNILVKNLKENGIIIIGLYNKYGRLRLRLKNKLLDLIAGKNTEKRLKLAVKLFFGGRMPKQGINWLADKFAHPLERYYSVEEILKWFNENNIKFLASKPEIEGNTFLTQLKWLIKKEAAFFLIAGRLNEKSIRAGQPS